MSYDEMSNFEINQAVAKIQCAGQSGIQWLPQKKVLPEFDFDALDDACHLISPLGNEQSVDFCSNWEDAAPVITNNKIAVMPNTGDMWKSGVLPEKPNTIGWAHYTVSRSPLRAAMIAYLKMHAAKTLKPTF